MQRAESVVLITRMLGQYLITHTVDLEKLQIQISLEDFMSMFQANLLKEIGSVRWVVKDTTYEKRVSDAFPRALTQTIEAIKQETAKVAHAIPRNA